MEYYSCHQCIDIAIDEVVDETEMPPQLKYLNEEEKQSSITCSFCNNEAIYVVHG